MRFIIVCREFENEMKFPLLLLFLLYIHSHGSDVIPVVCLLSGHLPLLEIIDPRSFSLKHHLIGCNPKLSNNSSSSQ